MQLKKSKDTPKPSGDIKVSNYAVAFLDILGQRAALRDCGLLPDSLDEFLPIARQSVAVVQNLHRSFDEFYSALSQPPNTSLVHPNLRASFIQQQRTDLKYQRFSDGLVGFVSLAEDYDSDPLNGVYGLMGACGALCLLGLAIRQPIRGGFEIAWGVELNKSELYGCVVAKTYELESRVARYPRIVVGHEVMKYLSALEQLPGDSVQAQYRRSLALVCKELIGQSDDGEYIIDYLGEGFEKYMMNNVDRSLYAEAAQYVSDQLEYWTSEGNSQLSDRYSELMVYFDRNRARWKT